MLGELALVHPCGETVVWKGGAYLGMPVRRRGCSTDAEPISHCPRCGEWLGSAFLSAKVTLSPSNPRGPRPCPWGRMSDGGRR